MSEREFEVYLRLIAKLLRLSEAQREAISDELRDHMENRLEELMDGGLSKQAAIHTAIEEFGDAAGLADQFTQITRKHTLRRRIMKTSIGVMATAAAVALTFLYMLPTDRPGVQGPASLIAQQTEVPAETAGQTALTLDMLSQRITVNYQDNGLAEVFDHLRHETGTNLFVNWTILESAGCDAEHPVTLALQDTPATTVLSLMFQLINPTLNEPLDYAVLDDVVVIATASEISNMRVVRIYDCLDLMKRGSATQADAGGDPFGETLDADDVVGRGGGYGGFQGGYGGGEYGGGYGAYGSGQETARPGAGGRGAGYGMARPAPKQDHASELIQVVHTLLDAAGSVSSYDGMLIVIAGHKTHQRIQETLTLMRVAQQQR